MRFLRPFLLSLGGFCFAFAYVLCFPVYVLGLRYLSDYRPLIRLSMWMSQLWFFCSGLRWRLHYAAPLVNGQPYVLCANHSSYLDVPAIFLTGLPLVFVGKSELSKIPLFGYMYKRMHITVDRSILRSRYEVLARAQKALSHGKSLVFFPEGGIRSKNPPLMASFQEGAFRTAIEAQVPVVPMTVMYNWMIMPKYHRNPPYKPYRHLVHLQIHTPIPTQGMQAKDASALLQRVKACIEQPLRDNFSTLFPKTNAITSA